MSWIHGSLLPGVDCLKKWFWFGRGKAIFARIGCAEVYAGLDVAENRLAAANESTILADHLQAMALGFKRVADFFGNALFDHHIAAASEATCEARGIHRG